MARANRCADGQTDDCPRDDVWGVYSSLTTSNGTAELGFLRAWADGALHPADILAQWWT